MAYKLGDNGKVFNAKIGKAVRQNVAWARKLIGGQNEAVEFSSFMLLKGVDEKSQARHASNLLALNTDGRKITSIILSGKVTSQEALELLIDGEGASRIDSEQKFQIIESKKITSSKVLKSMAGEIMIYGDYAKRIMENRLIPDAAVPDEFIRQFNTLEISELRADYPEFARKWLVSAGYRAIANENIPMAIRMMEDAGLLKEYAADIKIRGYGGSYGHIDHVSVEYGVFFNGSPYNALSRIITGVSRYDETRTSGLDGEILDALKNYPKLQEYAKVALGNSLSHAHGACKNFSFKEIAESPELKKELVAHGMDPDFVRLENGLLATVYALGM